MHRLACLIALSAGVVAAQNTASLPLVNQQDPATIQDLINAIRTGADCRDVQYDEASRAFQLRCADASVAMAQWVLRQADRPAGAPTPSAPVSYTYTGGSGKETENTAVRMFFLDKNDSAPDVQDFLNILRTGADIQRVFPISSMKALLVRSVPERVETAEWMIRQLDQPAQPGKMAIGQFRLTGAEQADPRVNRTTAIRVFWLTNPSAQWIVDWQNILRTGCDIQRVFPLNSRHAVLLRGEPERVVLAEWLAQQLDQKPQTNRKTASYEYLDPVFSSNSRSVRVLFLDPLLSVAALNDLQGRIRREAQMQRILPMYDANALVVEGRPEQVAAAEKIVRDAEEAAIPSK
ncbi:MAG TPA: hypothetical protein VML19_04700 [Verrucomicrobiae bacterium]|nr:hypothetical protein [Verrucomicrobiae bacterium]